MGAVKGQSHNSIYMPHAWHNAQTVLSVVAVARALSDITLNLLLQVGNNDFTHSKKKRLRFRSPLLWSIKLPLAFSVMTRHGHLHVFPVGKKEHQAYAVSGRQVLFVQQGIYLSSNATKRRESKMFSSGSHVLYLSGGKRVFTWHNSSSLL